MILKHCVEAMARKFLLISLIKHVHRVYTKSLSCCPHFRSSCYELCRTEVCFAEWIPSWRGINMQFMNGFLRFFSFASVAYYLLINNDKKLTRSLIQFMVHFFLWRLPAGWHDLTRVWLMTATFDLTHSSYGITLACSCMHVSHVYNNITLTWNL